jgi:hypothetical protein
MTHYVSLANHESNAKRLIWSAVAIICIAAIMPILMVSI